MHASCLGYVQYLLGNILVDVFRRLGGVVNRAADTLAEIVSMIKAGAKALALERPPVNALTWSMLHSKSGPKLKTKATEGRHLATVMEFVLRVFLPPRSSHEHMAYTCLHNLVQMYDVLKHWADGSGPAAASHGRRSLVVYGELFKASLEERGNNTQGYMRWRVVPKMHLLQHILEDQVFTMGCARDAWCPLDESEIGAAVKVAESCHPSTVHRAVIEKHRAL